MGELPLVASVSGPHPRLPILYFGDTQLDSLIHAQQHDMMRRIELRVAVIDI